MSIRIREATPADLDVVMHHRRAMFADMGTTPTNEMRLRL